jgi:hypothetical protein
MPEGELPQQRSQGRRRVHPVEQRAHPTRAQHVEIIDTVRASTHPRDHTQQLRHRVRRVPDLIRGWLIETFSAMISGSRVCSANPSTGTNPAQDTRLSSSKRADSAVNLGTLTLKVPFSTWHGWCVATPSSQLRGHFPYIGTPPSTSTVGGSRLRPPVRVATSAELPLASLSDRGRRCRWRCADSPNRPVSAPARLKRGQIANADPGATEHGLLGPARSVVILVALLSCIAK